MNRAGRAIARKASAVILCAATCPAAAGTSPPPLSFNVNANGADVFSADYASDTRNNDESVFGGQGWMAGEQTSVNSGMGSLDMDFALFWSGATGAEDESDVPATSAFVVNNFSITNNTGTTQLLVIDALVVIDQIGLGFNQDVDHGGQVAGGLTDANVSGHAAVTVAPGQSLYETFVDGTSTATMYDGLQNFEVDIPVGSTSIPWNSFVVDGGAPNPTENDILMRYTFTLTPGDSMSLSAFYFVQCGLGCVPAPGGLAAIVAATFLGGTRKRRTS